MSTRCQHCVQFCLDNQSRKAGYLVTFLRYNVPETYWKRVCRLPRRCQSSTLEPTPEQLLEVLPFARGDDDRSLLLGRLSYYELLPQEWWHDLVLGTSSTDERLAAVDRLDGRHPDDDRVKLLLLADRSRYIRQVVGKRLSESGGLEIVEPMFAWYARTLRPPKRIKSYSFHDITGGLVYGLRTGTLERAREVLGKSRARLDRVEIEAIHSWFPEGLDHPWEVDDIPAMLASVRKWRDQSTGGVFTGLGLGPIDSYTLDAYKRADKRRLRA